MFVKRHDLGENQFLYYSSGIVYPTYQIWFYRYAVIYISTEDIVKMADFVLKNNLFEFDSTFYKQISGTAIGTKFAPPCACIFMDHIETKFLKTQDIKPWFWKRFVDDIFFIWTESEESL